MLIYLTKVGSPTAFADQTLLDKLVATSQKFKRAIFVPCGAFWGASDIRKMASKNALKGLRVTMKKHPKSLILNGSLKEKLDENIDSTEAITLYEGIRRDFAIKNADKNCNTQN